MARKKSLIKSEKITIRCTPETYRKFYKIKHRATRDADNETFIIKLLEVYKLACRLVKRKSIDEVIRELEKILKESEFNVVLV